jgi:hypothetical protein
MVVRGLSRGGLSRHLRSERIVRRWGGSATLGTRSLAGWFGVRCFIIGVALYRLGVILIGIEGGIELSLACEQFLEVRLMLESPVGLRTVISDALAESLQVMLFLLHQIFQTAKGALNTQDGAERIVGIEMRCVRAGRA